jgi:hypothetical protein
VTEVVVEISIAGASGTPVFQAVERTNRKKVHMNGKEDWGGKASTFQFGAGHGLKKHYPIPAGLPEKVVASVAVRRKSQYFLPDESFPPVFRRDFPLDLSTLPAQ